MEALKSQELYECGICLEPVKFNEVRKFKILQCGHSLCTSCIETFKNRKDESLVNCCLCKGDRKILGDNNIINDVLKCLSYLDINKKIFAKFSFSYCETCDLFISNYSYDFHALSKHKIKSFLSYNIANLKDLFNKPSRLSYKETLFYVLFIFNNPDLIRINFDKYSEIEEINKKNFTFYGETIPEDEIKNSKFLKLMITFLNNYNKKGNNYLIKKGYVVGKELQVIYGYFLYTDKDVVERAFGILKFGDIQFFGLINLFSLSGNCGAYGFSMDTGIFDNGLEFFIGNFHNPRSDSFPVYDYGDGEIIQKNSVQRKINGAIKNEHIFNNELYSFEDSELSVKINKYKKYNFEVLYEKDYQAIKYYLISVKHSSDLIKKIKIIPKFKSKLIFDPDHKFYESEFKFNDNDDDLSLSLFFEQKYFVFSYDTYVPLDPSVQTSLENSSFFCKLISRNDTNGIFNDDSVINCSFDSIGNNLNKIFEFFNLLFNMELTGFKTKLNRTNIKRRKQNNNYLSIQDLYSGLVKYKDPVRNNELNIVPNQGGCQTVSCQSTCYIM